MYFRETEKESVNPQIGADASPLRESCKERKIGEKVVTQQIIN